MRRTSKPCSKPCSTVFLSTLTTTVFRVPPLEEHGRSTRKPCPEPCPRSSRVFAREGPPGKGADPLPFSGVPTATVFSMPEYSQGIHLERFAGLRARGHNTERRPPAKSTDVGLQTDATEKSRTKLAKSEATAHKAMGANLAVLADNDATTAQRDEKGIADARAQKALFAASYAAAADVEENREVIGSVYAAETEEAGALLVDVLSEAHEIGRRYATARAAECAMQSRNPADRLNPPVAGKIPGGGILANLVALAEREVGLIEPFDRVTVDEYNKLKRGEPATTIDDRTVDALHGRVRVAYGIPLSVLRGDGRAGPFL